MLEQAQAALERRTGLAFDAAARMRLAAGLDAAAADGRDPRATVEALEAGDERVERELIEAVTLQETRFFRDPPVFEALANEVLPALPDPVTVWSAGCALGQEAYSLAMLLAEQGRRNFRVVATDLSPDAVARTRAGIYTARELRGLDAARIDRHMQPLADGAYRVDEGLRAAVDAQVHNLGRGALPDRVAECRLVLCRYVLIYVQRDVVGGFLDRLHVALPAGALVVVGAAESLWHLTDRFALEPLGAGFAYRRTAPVPAAGAGERPADVEGRVRTPSGPLRERRSPHRAPEAAAARRHAGDRSSSSTPSDADADRRRVPEAPAIPAPDAAELLAAGEAAHAAGEHAAAAGFFRQAAYLAPADPLAHLRLGLALEADGDPGAQRAFRAAFRALGDADPAVLERELGGHVAADLARLLADRLGTAP